MQRAHDDVYSCGVDDFLLLVYAVESRGYFCQYLVLLRKVTIFMFCRMITSAHTKILSFTVLESLVLVGFLSELSKLF